MTPRPRETAAAPEVAALHWHDEVKLHKHKAVVGMFPAELQVCRLHKTARQWQSCPAHGTNLCQFPHALLQSNGHPPKPQGWGPAHSCAEHTGHSVPNERDLLNGQHLLHWRCSTTYHEKKHGMTVRCCFRAPLIQNTWSFSRQALKTGMAQSFRQELQKQIPFPFQLIILE